MVFNYEFSENFTSSSISHRQKEASPILFTLEGTKIDFNEEELTALLSINSSCEHSEKVKSVKGQL